MQFLKDLQAQRAQRVPAFLKVEAATLTWELDKCRKMAFALFSPNLLLNNGDARLELRQHVVGESAASDTGRFGTLGGELKALKREAHEAAG